MLEVRESSSAKNLTLRRRAGIKAKLVAAVAALAGSVCLAGVSPSGVPTPESILGYRVGSDFHLASYSDSLRYFRALAKASDRVALVRAGRTSRGVDMIYAVISSPRNLARFEHFKDLSRRLADSRDLTDRQAHQLAKEAKIIVHIDGGMHSDEAAAHQLPIELAYKLASTVGDPRIDAILENVILVLWPTLNPDGQNMIADWYAKNVGTEYEVSPMPWLFQEYVGHDNNRDGYMLNMVESQVVSRAQRDYSPAVFYSQHQKAPFPARIWMPPFAEPISSNIHPLMRSWTNVFGTNMMAAFENERLPGAIAQARYDNWYSGFLDYIHVFRHSISFFTETAGHEYATPFSYDAKDFPKKRQDFKAEVMYPSPWKGGLWRLADAVRYMDVASFSVLDTASKYRETLLYNRYQSARDTIAQYRSEGPRAYVIPSGQADLPEAAMLAGRMAENGLEVHQADREIRIKDATFPAGSWVILMDQPFAGLAKELFEPQRYPDAVLDGNGKPVSLSYDVTGWTLPMQMGVSIATVTETLPDSVRASLRRVIKVDPPAGGVHGVGTEFLLDPKVNASYHAINDVLKSGGSVGFTERPAKSALVEATGDIVIHSLPRSAAEEIARKYSLQVSATDRSPISRPVAAARIGLYRPWKPSIDEGWTRWILEQYGYSVTSLYNADMKAGSLRERFDTIVIPDIGYGWLVEGFSEREDEESRAQSGGVKPSAIRAEYAGGIGGEGAMSLREFVSRGGSLLTFNRASSAVIDLLGLPVTNVLAGLHEEDFFCSGALLEVEISDAGRPAVFGMPARPVVMFEKGPAFDVRPGFNGTVLLRYPENANPLKSGVLLHPERIQGKAAAIEVNYGAGHVFLYGFRPQWRAQSHGTYKLIFNALYSYPPDTSDDSRKVLSAQ